jgi:hypothetical protein
VGGLIAQVESELPGGEDVSIFKQTAMLEAQSAGAEPFVVGETLNEDAFGFGLRLVFRFEASAELGEFSGIFVFEEVERLVVVTEPVGGAVAGGGLLALWGIGPGGMAGVQLVRVDLCGGGHGRSFLVV